MNLTTLLVLTTLFISISNSLPRTAYVKLIDIWLIFCLFIPFIEVLLHTITDVLREDVREMKERSRNRSSNKPPPAVYDPPPSPSSASDLKYGHAWDPPAESTPEETRLRMLNAVTAFGKLGLPFTFFLFCVFFFIYGVFVAQNKNIS